MNTKQLLFCALTVCSTLASTAALAGNAPLQQVQKKWAECQYSTPDGDEKEQCFHRSTHKCRLRRSTCDLASQLVLLSHR